MTQLLEVIKVLILLGSMILICHTECHDASCMLQFATRQSIYIYLFILDPVGPMIQRHLQEKYMHSSQLAHRQGLLRYHRILRGTSSNSDSMKASQIS